MADYLVSNLNMCISAFVKVQKGTSPNVYKDVQVVILVCPPPQGGDSGTRS